ncbi:hypothetical protein [Microbacterium ginsengisoli]|jgi:hypothetical protein|uniref:hypothetical protein n=1 Tax=Microbacterium sp. CJ88 TaxID=3445672 RepID=UPI001AC4F996|nr:hypothetical protein [Microbacterium sp.]MBN9208362.1 hypothetical protein [Microbacterium ginsengisoli]
MLGYDARVHEIGSHVSAEDIQRIGKLPYAERADYVSTLTSQQVAHVAYRTWVDHLLTASEGGRARMLQDGGYPYLFHAPGAEIKTNFASADVEAISALDDATWYLVEAWDQS